MYCMKCNKHVADCDCPDIQERLASLGTLGTNTAAKFCRRCDQHYARCKCAEPDFFIRIEGGGMPMSALGKELKSLEQIMDEDKGNK